MLRKFEKVQVALGNDISKFKSYPLIEKIMDLSTMRTISASIKLALDD